VRCACVKNVRTSKTELDTKNAFLQQLQTLAFEFIEVSKNAIDNLSDIEHQALEKLSKDKTIIITKADKGNAVVIQNKSDYIIKIQQLLQTDGKFKMLKEDETVSRESSLQRTLRRLSNHALISKDVYNEILPCGSRSGIMYGLPKIHKTGTPLRPIISAVGTYNYKLAKYLDKILKPLVPNENYILKDTFDFVNKVSNIAHVENQHMVSFDVESLFTNIPTLETIEIILNRAFKHSEIFHQMNRKTLKNLLIICTQKSHFQFNGNYYDQIDGVAMGSPLGPLFANIFMDEFEQNHMQKLKDLGVKNWMRFVDDVFSVIENKSCSNNILEFMNSQHKNIKFTIEMEKNNKIPFLDTSVTRKETGFTTTIYHKPTFTGVYLNWTSLTARKYKISLIYCLCDRIWRICTNQNDREKEFRKLKHTLAKNEYPEHIIENEIEKFIKNRTTQPPTQEQQENIQQVPTVEQQTADELNNTILLQQLPVPPDKEKQIKYIVLPYHNNKVDAISSKLTKLVNSTFENLELRVAFQTPNEIGKKFPFKDNIKNKHLRSLVVYQVKCETCNQTYIGKCKRILQHRITEHNNAKKDSAIQTHKKLNPTHTIDANSMEIIDKADNNFKLMLKEMLHINKLKPELNTQHAAAYKKANNKDMFITQLNTIIIARKA